MEERIRLLRENIDAEWKRIDENDYINDNPIRRMQLEIELLEHGCQVDQDHHGLLVNQKFIVAVSKNKWCVKGKYVWYRYKDVQTFVSKYIS
jgi:hypothetical protein